MIFLVLISLRVVFSSKHCTRVFYCSYSLSFVGLPLSGVNDQYVGESLNLSSMGEDFLSESCSSYCQGCQFVDQFLRGNDRKDLISEHHEDFIHIFTYQLVFQFSFDKLYVIENLTPSLDYHSNIDHEYVFMQEMYCKLQFFIHIYY